MDMCLPVYDRLVSSGYSGFLPQKDHTNVDIAANENDVYKVS